MRMDHVPETVEEFCEKWRVEKERYRAEWEKNGGWPAKYVEFSFDFKGKHYCVKPGDIGLETGNSWDEGFMEFIDGGMWVDLRAMGAENIFRNGFLD